MVGTLVKLQLRLFVRGLTGSAAKVFAMVMAGLFLLGLWVAVAIGLWALRDASHGLHGAVTTTGFAVLTLSWPVMAMLAAGSDQTLDPGRFALFPVRARQLMPGLLVAGLLGLGGVFTVLCGLALVASWTNHAAAAVMAVVAVVLGIVTCQLLTRALTAAFNQALSSRRFRDFAAAVLGIVAMTLGLAMQAISRWVGAAGVDGAQLRQVGEVVAWTPVGWAWALPWDVAEGRWLVAIVRLVLALVLVAALALVWQRHLDQGLVSPLESSGGGGTVKAHSIVERMVPRSVAGAIAARSLRYWRRDPRHLVQFVGAALMPVLMAAPVLVNGESGGMGDNLLVYPVIGSLVMSAMVVANEINYDGSALWSQIQAGVRGRDDRWGRLLAMAWLFVPITLLVDLGFLVFTRSYRHTPALVGASLGALLAASAVGTVAGAYNQYAQPPSGQNAFGKSSGGGVTAVVWAFLSMGASAMLSLPFLVPAIMSGSRPWLGWAVLVLGPLYGALLVWGSVVWGGRVLDRSWPEVLDRITWKG